MSGTSWSATRAASCAHAGTLRVPRPGWVHITLTTDGPCCGLKKHGTRSSGSGAPATRAWTHASAYRPADRVSVTVLTSSALRIRGTSRRAVSYASSAAW